MASSDDNGGQHGGGGGFRPTGQLRGVQFLGQPEGGGAGGGYHVRHPDGTVEGPLPNAVVADRIRNGELTGDEGVSRDGQFWIPVMAVPEFALVFRQAGGAGGTPTMLGTPAPSPAAAGSTSLLAGDAALSGSYPSFLDDDIPDSPFASRAGAPASTTASPPAVDDIFGGGTAPAPLGGSGLGFDAESSASRMASGAWSSLPGGDEISVSKAVAPNPDALSNLPGVRRLTSAQPAIDADPTTPSLPRGFADLPAPMEQSGELPIPVPGGVRPTGVLPPIAASRRDPLADLPIARGDLPPQPAQNLPRAAGGGALPPAPGGGDVASAQGLPGSTHGMGAPPAATGRGPGSTLTSPESRPTWGDASGLNLSGLLDLDAGGSRPHGTQMMSAFGGEQPELPAAVDPGTRGPELPTSTRAASSFLDDLGGTDDIFATGGAVSGAGVGTAGAAPAADPFGFGQDPFAQLDDSGPAPAAGGGEFSGFFSAPEAGATHDAPVAPATAAAGDVARPRPRGGGGAIVAAALGLLVLAGAGGALWYFVLRDAPVEVVAPPVVAPEPEVVVAAEATLGPLTDLRQANYVDTEAYVQIGRQAVAAGRNDTDRARTMVGLGLMLAQNPANSALAEELGRLHAELGDDATDAGAQLARLAWAAATAQGDIAELARPILRDGAAAEQAWANTFVGIGGLQRFRGVDYSTPEPAPTAAEASGEGSGAAALEEPVAAEEPVAVAESATLDPAAARALDAALAADSDLVAARYFRGVVALAEGDATLAERHFAAVAEAHPQNVAALVGLTEALVAQGRLGEADARIQRVVDELEAVSSTYERGASFLVSGEVAIARLQPELAIEALLSALQVDPGNARAIELLGEQFVEAGQYVRALEYFQANADLVQAEPTAAIGLIRAHMGLASWTEAATAAGQAAERFPRDGRFSYLQGQIKEAQADFEGARESYQLAAQLDSEMLIAQVALADLDERSARPAEARALLDAAVAAGPRDAATATAIGEMYLRIGETNAAVALFRRAVELNRSYARARLNLSDYYLQTEQDDRALGELEDMLASGVDSPRVRYLHARALGEVGQLARAIEGVRALLEDDRDNADYLFLLGRLQFLAGVEAREAGDTAAAQRAFESARTQFDRTLAEVPSHEEATYYTGRTEIEVGSYNSAITALTTVSERNTNGEYHYWLGYALELGDQATQALAVYGRAITEDVGWALENPEVFYRRGRLLQVRGATTGAYRDLRIALTLRPDHAPASWTLGRVFFEERRFEEAIAAIEHSLAVAPEQPLAHYYAGLAYLNQPTPSPVSALGHLEAAREGGLAQRYPDIHQRLGYVYRDLNRRQDAVNSFRRYLVTPTITYDERRATENELRRFGVEP